jgi:hypothetical protein
VLCLPDTQRRYVEGEPDVLGSEERVAELQRRGVTMEKYDLPGTDADGITTEDGTKAAWFKDTEGNIMAIIQLL